MAANNEDFNRAKELKEFDDSKLGVKGIVDKGIKTIPPIFIHPPETLSNLKPKSKPDNDIDIPTVDLSGVDSSRWLEIVEQVSHACRHLGFFQIINHGISTELLNRMIEAVKAFHEQPIDVKKVFYRREAGKGVSYFSNIDLFHSVAASWRDTLQLRLGPNLPNLEEIPELCRNEVVEWSQEVLKLGEMLMELLSSGLGLDVGRLKEMTCLESRVMVGHYYPYCPQPDLTVGITSHTDPGIMTVLLQDQMGGLQIKHGEEWLDVKPVPGALVINVGDVLQIMSNDNYKSVEHRVLANPHKDPRVSIAVFFSPGNRENFYGPSPELISTENPALFRQFTYAEYLRKFFTKELDGKSLVNFYRL